MATWSRRVMLVLPGAAVAVVALGLFMAGRTRPVVGARVRGGPTEGAHAVSFRVEVIERAFERERPWSGPVVVDLRLLTDVAMQFAGNTDADGVIDVRMTPLHSIRGPMRIRVSVGEGTQSITEGMVRVMPETWAPRPPGEPAWVTGSTGALVLRAAALHGAFAVPFEDALIVEARLAGKVAPGVALHASMTGASPSSLDTVTDDAGRGLLRVRPVEHGAQIQVEAKGPSGAQGSVTVSLPMIPGALHAAVVGACSDRCKLAIRSPIPRDKAYVAIVSAKERVAGGAVSLRADGKGGAEGELELPPRPSVGEPLWAVVSSEPDLHSPSVVGWPLDVRAAPEPRPTFEAKDVLWIDGMGARVAAEAARTRRMLKRAAMVSAVLLLFTGILVAWLARTKSRLGG